MVFDDILSWVGGWAPTALIVATWRILWLRNQPTMAYYYTVGLMLSSILNLILKGIFQQPRPMYNKHHFHLLKLHGKPFFFQNGVPFDAFGMPSNHAQTAVYTTMFLWLSNAHNTQYNNQYNGWIWYFYIPLTLLTCYQRVRDLWHSWFQVLVGGLLGGAFAYGMHSVVSQTKRGKLKPKADDMAIIFPNAAIG